LTGDRHLWLTVSRQLRKLFFMSLDESLRRYREGAFTDHDVTRCTGLSVRAWRELIKVGAVRTVTENRGPGRVRVCDANTLKRAAVIAALNRARFSLAVSGRIAYLLPLDSLLYGICDPCTILLDAFKDVDPVSGLPPRVKQPKADWFDPDTPAKADPEDDWLIEIYEDRFVGQVCGTDLLGIYGDLRDEGTRFVSWFASHRLIQSGGAAEEGAHAPLPHKVSEFIAKWEYSWSDRIDLKFLDYQFEDHSGDDDQLSLAAQATIRSPLFKTTVNASLAVKKALRRYLGIEPVMPDSESRESA
jgi:hypothetical protein